MAQGSSPAGKLRDELMAQGSSPAGKLRDELMAQGSSPAGKATEAPVQTTEAAASSEVRVEGSREEQAALRGMVSYLDESMASITQELDRLNRKCFEAEKRAEAAEHKAAEGEERVVSLEGENDALQGRLEESKRNAGCLERRLSEAMEYEQALLEQVRGKTVEIEALTMAQRGKEEQDCSERTSSEGESGESGNQSPSVDTSKENQIDSLSPSSRAASGGAAGGGGEKALLADKLTNRAKPPTPLRKHLSAAQSDAQVMTLGAQTR